jgi:hypothetical protein
MKDRRIDNVENTMIAYCGTSYDVTSGSDIILPIFITDNQLKSQDIAFQRNPNTSGYSHKITISNAKIEMVSGNRIILHDGEIEVQETIILEKSENKVKRMGRK